jgi:hypothetical protein
MFKLRSTPKERLLLIALVVRIVPAALIYGTDDVSGWWTWGKLLASGANPYLSKYPLVWPPFWLPFAWLSYGTAEATGLPFHFIIKLFPIAADVALTLFLYAMAEEFGCSPWKTALMYALNPIAIYSVAVHGQFDVIPTLCLTIAVVRMRHEPRPVRAGFWLGVAAAFKTWPLFVLPALLAPLRSMWKRALVAIIAIGVFVAALLVPWPFFGRETVTGVLRYRGALSWWGLSSMAYLRGVAVSPSLFSIIFFASMGVISMLLIATRTPAVLGALLLLLTFYVTAPGFGLQYLVWIVPIALLADQRRGLVYSLLAGLLIAFEVLVRPFTGHIGEMVRILPHAGYARAYGGVADHTYTTIVRLVLWLFFCWWWLVTIIRCGRLWLNGIRSSRSSPPRGSIVRTVVPVRRHAAGSDA